MKKWDLFRSHEVELSKEMILDELRTYPYPQLILGLTENCNLRCKYCIFSGNYEEMRTHTFKRMEKKTALKSVQKYIDYIEEWKEYAPDKQPVISFYGGEPLLRFDLIQEVIAYVQQKGFRTMFSMTTNGTLLTDSIIEYLVAHNVMISVSLDGSKEMHDKNRVFANDRGSFEVVYGNIRKLLAEIKRQGKEQLLPTMILSCYENETDMVALNDFFVQEKHIMKVMGGRLSKILDAELGDSGGGNDSMVVLLDQYLQEITAENGENRTSEMFFKERLFGTSLKVSHNRNINPYARNYSSLLGNACIPGSRMFVAVDGTFHMCEKISYQFPIGNCEDGLDINAISEIVEKWSSKFTEQCKECPYQSICGLCYASCAVGDNFDVKGICTTRKTDIERQLSILYGVLERNPDAMRDFSAHKDSIDRKYESFRFVMDKC
ncbi:radical SAM protein [Paenibacillus ihuae]|uniref:radical SAM protein n=1 Tax=Paenibacillus ihuae TaxID=1232431 RepID=UPI0006D564A6